MNQLQSSRVGCGSFALGHVRYAAKAEINSGIRVSDTAMGHFALMGPPLQISDFQNFCLTAGANQHYSHSVPSLRGALRNVINAGRDAVDAGSALDEMC